MDFVAGKKIIYLVGMMGSGKSFWAGKLAHYYGVPAYDLDRLVETEAGKSIKAIFSDEGEDFFRQMESALLKGVNGKKLVLATGGGTPCFFDNMAFMKNNGMVVWLNPSTEALVQRLSRNPGSRPVLEGHNTAEALREHLENLMAKRIGWYGQAHIAVDEHATIASITKQIGEFKTSPD